MDEFWWEQVINCLSLKVAYILEFTLFQRRLSAVDIGAREDHHRSLTLGTTGGGGGASYMQSGG